MKRKYASTFKQPGKREKVGGGKVESVKIKGGAIGGQEA